ACRPFGDNGPLAAARVDVDCHQVTGHSYPVKADAPDTCYLTIYARVVMAEKAHKRPQVIDQSVKPHGFTYPVAAVPVLLEPDPCGCIVDKEDVHRGLLAESINLIACVMPLRIALKVCRRALEVGGSVTTSNSAYPQGIPGFAEAQCLAVPEIEEPRQHLGVCCASSQRKSSWLPLMKTVRRGAERRLASHAEKSPAPPCLLVALSMRFGSGQIPKSPT